MTEPHPGQPMEPDSEPDPELDPSEQRLVSFLNGLGDDPEAPPPAVTAESVLAAVRAQGPATAGSSDAIPADKQDEPHPAVVDIRHRSHARRRKVLVAVLAAAGVAAVAAVVIPLSLRSQDATTSADSARDSAEVAAQAAVPGDESAAGSLVPGAGAIVPSESGVATGPADAALPESPGTSAATAPPTGAESAPSVQAPNAGSPGADGTSAGCVWSAPSEDAAAALTGSLPEGRFGAPAELVAACTAEPVAGARVPDATGGSLVVRISKAPAGACAGGSAGATEAGTRCVPQGAGRYLSTDLSGSQTAYAYANGLEVAVARDHSGTGPPHGDQLTADQLLATAQAVLGALS